MFIRRSSAQKVWLDLMWNDDLLEMRPCDFRRDADVVLMDFQTHRKTSLLFHYPCAGKELEREGHHAAGGGRARSASCKCFTAGSSSSVLLRSGGSNPYSFRKAVCSLR